MVRLFLQWPPTQWQNYLKWMSPKGRVQLEADIDTESQNVGTNTRLRWTVKPGKDFIVWNRGWQRLILSPNETSIVPQSDVVAIKLRWTFRR